MNLTFFRNFATSKRNSVNWCIPLLCGLFLLFSGSVVNADETSALRSSVQNMEALLEDWNSNLRHGGYWDRYHSDMESLLTTNLAVLRSNMYMLLGWLNNNQGFGSEDNLRFYLRRLVAANESVASNPWWATNSGFAFSRSGFSLAFPRLVSFTDGQPGIDSYTSQPLSFPQFLSAISMLRNRGVQDLQASFNGRVPLQYNMVQSFGSSSFSDYASSFNFENGAAWTFEDWLATWLRQYGVRREDLSALSNAIASVSSSGSFEDVLAGNPYWVTNSAFAPVWPEWNNYVPSPQDYNGISFPEAFSSLLSHRYTVETNLVGVWNAWGVGGQNRGHYYSFEDFLAEALRSNLVLSISGSISNLEEELAQTDYVEQVAPTNPPLPEYVDPIAGLQVPVAGGVLADGQSAFYGQVSALAGMLDSATPNSEIVVIPEFTVGGIHVAEYRANLATSVTPVAHRIMFLLWYVALFSSLFSLAQSEFAFYSSLGRHWAVSHGALTERNL